jgi:hypothetical protein
MIDTNKDGRIIHDSKHIVLPQTPSFREKGSLTNHYLAGVFCQISTTPTSLSQGLRSPPLYAPPSYNDELPTYNSLAHPLQPNPHAPEKSPQQPADDVLHFLNHSTDSVLSLSLQYNVPIVALRRANGITSDHLLHARRTVVIPGEFYRGGVSLSPRPVEGEEEEARKGKIRRWMVACKVVEWVPPFLVYLNFGIIGSR